MNRLLQESIQNQRRMIAILLEQSMSVLASACRDTLSDRKLLDATLSDRFSTLPYCKYLYAMAPSGHQISSTVSTFGKDHSQYGRDRSDRPYMQGIYEGQDFRLSEAYISLSERRPSLTATQMVRDTETGEVVAVLGADYDLRELPHTESIYKEPTGWRQIKGDPAIRGHLFEQHRVQSRMDSHFAEILALLQELMEEHGVFHGKLHFSSSRATVWQVDDPFSYRLLDYEDLTDPDTCLAYPRRRYFDKAIVPRDAIPRVFEQFRVLRFADDTVYLRSGSLNIANGIVGLNFSCDGTHYMPFEEFLGKDQQFWFGTGCPGGDIVESDPVEAAIEQICLMGCTQVSDIITGYEKGDDIECLGSLTPQQSKEVMDELKSIMSVYEICEI